MWVILPSIALGVLAGGLINYLSDHLPVWRALTRPRCTQCESYQPFGNYLVWPRQCGVCGHRRRARSLLIDAFAVSATVWMALTPPPRIGFGYGYLLLIFFTLVVVIDLEHRLILHPISAAGGILGLIAGVSLHGLSATLMGGAVGFLVMWGFYQLGALFTRLVGRLRGSPVEEIALGFGDVTLAAILGLLLGLPNILLALLLAILAGGVASLLYLLGMAPEPLPKL